MSSHVRGDQWRESAMCAQTDPEVFFPENRGNPTEAKKICLQCEVRAECLNYALKANERYGVWGGLSTKERNRLANGAPEKPLTKDQLRRKERDALIVTMAAKGNDLQTIAKETNVTDRTVHRVLAKHKSRADTVSA